MNEADFLGHFRGVTPRGQNQWSAKCPAHDDQNASLGLTHAGDKWLVKCFAGCSAEEVMAAAGLEMRDLFDHPREGRGPSGGGRYGLTLEEYAAAKRLDIEYLRQLGCADATRRMRGFGSPVPHVAMPYWDEHGATLAVRERYLIHGDDSGRPKFLWRPGRRRLSLYGLWKQPENKDYIIVVEGESDSQALWHGGWAALGLPGADTILKQPETPETLMQYGTIYTSIEADTGGMKILDWLARQNKEFRARVRLFSIPLPAKDPSGLWLQCRDAEEFNARLREILAAAVPLAEFHEPPEIAELRRRKAAKTPHSGRTDGNSGTGDAPRGPGRPKADTYGLAAQYFETVRKDGQLTLRFYAGNWYEYWDNHFERLGDALVRGRVQGYIQDNGEEFRVSPGQKSCNDVLANLQSVNFCAFHRDPPLPFWVSDGSSASGWTPFRNKVVNLLEAARARWAELNGAPRADEAGYVRDNTADLFATYALPYEWSPEAECPTFDRWLCETVPSMEGRRMLLMMMGLLLIPTTRYNVFFFLFGPAGCGKSTFVRLIQEMLGKSNYCAIRLEEFDDKFATWQLTEKLANIVGDQQTNDPFGKIWYILDGQFKDTVSGGSVQSQRKHQDVTTLPVIARHVFAANALPAFSAASEAIWDRLRAIPFTRRFRDTDGEDKHMPDKLIAELPGILNRVLPALGELLEMQRFPESPESLEAKAIHRQACDPDAQWLSDHYELRPGGFTPCDEIYKAYCTYMFEHGYKRRSVAAFNQHVYRVFARRPSQKQSMSRRMYVFEDLCPRADAPPESVPDF